MQLVADMLTFACHLVVVSGQYTLANDAERCMLCLSQVGLQGEVAALQAQLTWLQSHASLQDNINKQLMQEILHLREAMGSLQAVPPI